MLIGLSGAAGSGKDTIYKILRDTYPAVSRRAFADPLKVSAARALGFDGSTEECIEFCNILKDPESFIFAEREIPNSGEFVDIGIGYQQVSPNEHEGLAHLSGRSYLQRYGTEAHREVFGTDFWVDATLPLDLDHDDEIVVVTDVRFPNEAKRVQDLYGVIWRVDRPVERIEESAHASEAGLPEEYIDHVIHNTGTLDHLAQEVQRGIRHYHDTRMRVFV